MQVRDAGLGTVARDGRLGVSGGDDHHAGLIQVDGGCGSVVNR